jgi:nucleoside-diphosphate-sugar epimerase
LANFAAEQAGINTANLDVKECDLKDKHALNDPIKDCDVVIHLAASMGSSIVDGQTQYQQTLKITEHLLEAINTSNIKTLVLVSSISVLDYAKQAPYSNIDENTPLCENDTNLGDYARMKRDQELLCRQWQLQTGKQLIIIRPGLVYSDTELSDSHAGFIKKGIGIAVLHKGQVPLISVVDVAEKIIGVLNQTFDSNALFHLIAQAPVLQADYLKRLKQLGKLRFYVLIPWKIYLLIASIILWIFIKANKQDKIPDSVRANSVAARQKPFFFSAKKIDSILK